MVFSIDDKDFLDANKVKAIYGVAGRGKSSVINSFFQTHGIEYLWTTSTNKLKRDAAERYGCEVSTVCSGLFRTEDGRFYLEEKDPDIKTIVIDEILQTSEKVFSWIENHRGNYNIIVLTDMKQMLALDNNHSDKSFLQQFEEFLKKPYVISDEGTSTMRARNLETKEKIEYLYEKSDESAVEFIRDFKSGRFPIIPYCKMDFDKNNIYITHRNDIEDYMYNDKHFSMMCWDNEDLIPKGGIASKPPKDLSNHPIMSQLQAEKTNARSYLQLKNVGTCTRYQGSECTDTQKLYYIVTPGSRISNREWYTVVSRCWTLDSIVIVQVVLPRNKNLETFGGLPIKHSGIFSIRTEDEDYKWVKGEIINGEADDVHTKSDT